MGPTPLIRGRWVGGAAVAILLVGPGCTGPDGRARDRNGVTVSSRLGRRGGTLVLETTFRPDGAGFHIYSTTLPDGGVRGLGIPTRVVPGPGLAVLGAASASRPVRLLRIDPLDVELPVYPDGPVTISQPVLRTTGRKLTATVSYGACSAVQCLAPVENEVLSVSG